MDEELCIYLVGAVGVGKSSIALQLQRNYFVEEIDPTIWDTYSLQYDLDGRYLKLKVVDGLEPMEGRTMDRRHEHLRRHADAIVLVVDCTNATSEGMRHVEYEYEEAFRVLQRGADLADFQRPAFPPVVAWASKSDLITSAPVALDAGRAMLTRAIMNDANGQLGAELKRLILEDALPNMATVSAKTRDGLDNALKTVVLRALRLKEARRLSAAASNTASPSQEENAESRCNIS